ncbi:unnamed protein product [Anisakis simplex]|uniref:Phospholipase B-like n=1 Tax=Anisakis simplex TaxID=6269 RepID=A0A0M3KHT0_ANISI|nr:unnamed protein product [Anisakis simplex]
MWLYKRGCCSSVSTKTKSEECYFCRYNDYTHDEFSRCNCTPPYSAEAAISARGDLNPADGIYPVSIMGHRNHGGLDYKGTNYEMFQKLRFRAIGCPTYDNVPPFQWSNFDYVSSFLE